ncbi:hypothetical protein CSB92_1965 [Pseudomonas aeruginosa]|nr:hypothetical protein CSC32_6629 [Pseudomonas aeruginosa]AWF58245.1 hypothetical protein CSC30_3110 [Pseudomonas aeruginosa]AWF67703.1 hypothetical protein CSC27_5751 [Pseudomonas aeruginosa]AWZ84848.1 hypothetical protein CSC41_0998 [Pseudomonas aeruginosa]AZP63214.1 Uncharacterized protein PA1840_6026 [Pseudomonas aeruginosa]
MVLHMEQCRFFCVLIANEEEKAARCLLRFFGFHPLLSGYFQLILEPAACNR